MADFSTQAGGVGADGVARRVGVVGAGMAGLSAAYRLQSAPDVSFTIYEKQDYLGGTSRTIQFGDFRFDLGGHRFYTKKEHVKRLVKGVLGEDLLGVARVSRIYFNNRFVNYPLAAFNALKALGVGGACRAAASYAAARAFRTIRRNAPEETFEQWTVNRFGRYLYGIYFKPYTEKIWGVPCDQLSSEFANQRIRGLSFREAVKEAVLRKSVSSSLVRNFFYPRYGFGEIAEKLARHIEPPNRILTGHRVVSMCHDGQCIRSLVLELPDGSRLRHECDHVISSMAVSEILNSLEPPAPEGVRDAARSLRYRDMVILFLVFDTERVSRDHWIYVPSQDIRFARFHEPKNWSPEMAPADKTGIVLEYFCTEGDDVWIQPDELLARRGARDLGRLGLVSPDSVLDFKTVRVRKAYPIYALHYTEHLSAVTSYMDGLSNLQRIGRNATFCYTSSDHYIDMGLKAAENLMGKNHDLSRIGREPHYAESEKVESA